MHRELATTWAAADEMTNQMKTIKLSEKSTSTPLRTSSGGAKHALLKLLEEQEEKDEANETSKQAKWSTSLLARYEHETNKNNGFGGCQINVNAHVHKVPTNTQTLQKCRNQKCNINTRS